MSPFKGCSQRTSLSSAPLPWSSLQDAEVPLVSCLLGFPGLPSVPGYPAKQTPVPISRETAQVGFSVSHGTGECFCSKARKRLEVWGESGGSPEGKEENRAAGKHAGTTSFPSPQLPSAARRACPARTPTGHRYVTRRCEVWLRFTWLFDHSLNTGWRSAKWQSPRCKR